MEQSNLKDLALRLSLSNDVEPEVEAVVDAARVGLTGFDASINWGGFDAIKDILIFWISSVKIINSPNSKDGSGADGSPFPGSRCPEIYAATSGHHFSMSSGCAESKTVVSHNEPDIGTSAIWINLSNGVLDGSQKSVVNESELRWPFI